MQFDLRNGRLNDCQDISLKSRCLQSFQPRHWKLFRRILKDI